MLLSFLLPHPLSSFLNICYWFLTFKEIFKYYLLVIWMMVFVCMFVLFLDATFCLTRCLSMKIFIKFPQNIFQTTSIKSIVLSICSTRNCSMSVTCVQRECCLKSADKQKWLLKPVLWLAWCLNYTCLTHEKLVY